MLDERKLTLSFTIHLEYAFEGTVEGAAALMGMTGAHLASLLAGGDGLNDVEVSSECVSALQARSEVEGAYFTLDGGDIA